MNIYPLNIVIPLLILLPNIAYILLRPKDKIPTVRVNPLFVLLERVGQIGVIVVPLFLDINLNPTLAGGMAIALALYYLAWLRYFRTRKGMLLYSPFFGLLLPLAILPLMYFFLCAIALQNTAFYIAVALLAIGHIGVSYAYHSAYKF